MDIARQFGMLPFNPSRVTRSMRQKSECFETLEGLDAWKLRSHGALDIIEESILELEKDLDITRPIRNSEFRILNSELAVTIST